MTQNFYTSESVAANVRRGSRKRKPGGQQGNQNARKHGFYSRALTPELLALMGPAKQLEGVELELALARAKVKSIAVNDPRNCAVLCDALAVVARLEGMRQRHGRHTSLKVSRALKLVLESLALVDKKPNPRKPHNNGGAVSPPFPENG